MGNHESSDSFATVLKRCIDWFEINGKERLTQARLAEVMLLKNDDVKPEKDDSDWPKWFKKRRNMETELSKWTKGKERPKAGEYRLLVDAFDDLGLVHTMILDLEFAYSNKMSPAFEHGGSERLETTSSPSIPEEIRSLATLWEAPYLDSSVKERYRIVIRRIVEQWTVHDRAATSLRNGFHDEADELFTALGRVDISTKPDQHSHKT